MVNKKSHSLFSSLSSSSQNAAACYTEQTKYKLSTKGLFNSSLFLPYASSLDQNRLSHSCTKTEISLLIWQKPIPPKENPPKPFLSDQWIDLIHCTAAQSLHKINYTLKLPRDAVATLILLWLSTASSKYAMFPALHRRLHRWGGLQKAVKSAKKDGTFVYL